MFSDDIDTLLHKCLGDVPLIICKRSLRHDMDDLMAMVLPGMKLAVITDRDTDHALGEGLFRALDGRFVCTRVFLEGQPVADMQTVERVRRQSVSSDALIAVGSGTINDICKYAAFLDKKPYVVFPTAASMNGYLSANASITIDGYKTTCAAQMPKAVFCDLSLISGAPVRLNKSGLGDSLARPTAQADWLLSHLLVGTAYDDTPFRLLAPLEAELFDNARGIAKADIKSIELLVRTLLLSGLGMTIAKGSYPASQSEHMIAHAYEMISHRQNPHPDPAKETIKTLHGEEIGVTTLAMARLQENLLRQGPSYRPALFPAKSIEEMFGAHTALEAKKMFYAKLEKMETAGLNDETLSKRWDTIAEQLQPFMLAPDAIESILTAAEAPIAPEQLGWPLIPYNAAKDHARYLRDRFTFLDLV